MRCVVVKWVLSSGLGCFWVGKVLIYGFGGSVWVGFGGLLLRFF